MAETEVGSGPHRVPPPLKLSGAGVDAYGVGGLHISGSAHGMVVGSPLLEQTLEVEKQVIQLRAKFQDQAKRLKELAGDKEAKEKEILALNETLKSLQAKQGLQFLLSRVDARSHNTLVEGAELRDTFLSQEQCEAFVVSVDIRRSTELMLKARTPQLFATFIDALCSEFSEIVKDNWGVFDKFTGDGVLAFFPLFFSGRDAGYHALDAATRCHAAFARHYKASRSSFAAVLNDVGLGIGVDFGSTRLLKMADGLTVVGQPVVYACRLGGAPPGRTYLNQPAYEKVCERQSAAFLFSEEEIEIKHEGKMLAYSARPSGNKTTPKDPDWLRKEPGAST